MQGRAYRVGALVGASAVVVLAAAANAVATRPAVRAAASGVQLAAVSADSASDAWAVGTNTDTGMPTVLHWDGQRISASTPTSDVGGLNGVSAVSPTDVWAVGSTSPPRAHQIETLALHWDGTQWARVPSPDPSQVQNELRDVRALSPTDVWVSGDYLDLRTHSHKAFIARWDGTNWSAVAVPTPIAKKLLLDRYSLQPIAPTGQKSALAVARHVGRDGVESDLIMRWNGKRWKRAAGPNYRVAGKHVVMEGATFAAISVSPSGDAWAAGYFCLTSCPPFQTVAVHRGAAGWEIVRPPTAGNAKLTTVTVTSPSNAWATGTSNGKPLIAHWDGGSWQRVAAPPVRLASPISAVGASDAWVVGSPEAGGSELLHWDGASWSQAT